jgi:hypothetical protein
MSAERRATEKIIRDEAEAKNPVPAPAVANTPVPVPAVEAKTPITYEYFRLPDNNEALGKKLQAWRSNHSRPSAYKNTYKWMWLKPIFEDLFTSTVSQTE